MWQYQCCSRKECSLKAGKSLTRRSSKLQWSRKEWTLKLDSQNVKFLCAHIFIQSIKLGNIHSVCFAATCHMHLSFGTKHWWSHLPNIVQMHSKQRYCIDMQPVSKKIAAVTNVQDLLLRVCILSWSLRQQNDLTSYNSWFILRKNTRQSQAI